MMYGGRLTTDLLRITTIYVHIVTCNTKLYFLWLLLERKFRFYSQMLTTTGLVSNHFHFLIDVSLIICNRFLFLITHAAHFNS